MTRRGVLGTAALAGASALAGITPNEARADNPPAPPSDDDADRKRVLAAGFTEDEAECWILLNRAAGKFFSLPKLHEMDDHELSHAIHVLQNRLLMRPTYRRYKELAPPRKP